MALLALPAYAAEVPAQLPHLGGNPGGTNKPLKIFILAGQSNMEGPANVSTFDYIGDDPATAPMLKMMRGADGKPAVCDGAWISYLTGANDKNFVISGKLTAGYGSMWGQNPTKPGDKIGPEFTFGLTMDAALDEPVLIIKAAWGGKSLHTDFRSPSAGPFELPARTRELWDQHPQGAHAIPKAEDRPKWHAEKAKATGVYYRLMIEHVKSVLSEPRKVVPGYDATQGLEIAGFAWLQGFNDMVDGPVYPNHNQPDRYALYSELLAHFIRDVRKDLNAPKMPFVIGVMGVGGLKDQSAGMVAFRKAMAAPAEMPEFKGNVTAVQTAPFWSDELGAIADKHEQLKGIRHHLNIKHKDYANADGHMTEEQKNEYLKKREADLITPAEAALWKRGASNAGYHYLGCAKTFALMGKAFAEANLALMKQKRTPVTPSQKEDHP
jgi:alpha-galactosidase